MPPPEGDSVPSVETVTEDLKTPQDTGKQVKEAPTEVTSAPSASASADTAANPPSGTAARAADEGVVLQTEVTPSSSGKDSSSTASTQAAEKITATPGEDIKIQNVVPQVGPPQSTGGDASQVSDTASVPRVDMTTLGENSLEAIAAAQIAAGLGDFDFSSNSEASNDQPGATVSAPVQPAAATNTANQQGQRPASLPDQLAIASASRPNNEVASSTPSSATGIEVAQVSSSTNTGPPPNLQKPISTLNNSGQPLNASKISNQNAATGVQGTSTTGSSAAGPSSSNPSSAGPVSGSASMSTAPNSTNASLSSTMPGSSQASAGPSTLPSSIRPPQPQPNAYGNASRPSTNPLPLPPNALFTGNRPPPPRPGPPAAGPANVRPPYPPSSVGGRPPAPALPASALFTQGPPGMPSFAALLGSLGPQDLAMVAHAAMGLDANGDPLPGNEESHRALADAMRKLRESAAVRPPPHMFRPPYQQQYQNGVPLPRPPPGHSAQLARPRPKIIKPRPTKPPKQPPQDAWILARAASEGGSIDALGKTGDPLQDKLPLIAGPRPERAPPRGGPPPEKRFQCTKCDRAFARAYNLNTHFATHDPDPNRAKPFPCPYPSCKSEARSFSRKHDLQRHIASTHEAEPEPIIEIADAETGETIQSNLAKLGLGAPGRKFRCECGRAFVRRDALRKHSCEAMRGQSLADLEASSHSPNVDPRYGGRTGRDDADALARRAAGLPVIAGEGGDVDFEALAASFAADAAQEMQAAQEHAARRAGDDAESEAEDEDDAIANFASQLTAGAAAELGLTTTSGNVDVATASADKEVTGVTDVKGTEAAEGGAGGGDIQEAQVDDAAAQYIAQLHSQLGGGDGPSETPGLEGLMPSTTAPSGLDEQQEVVGSTQPQVTNTEGVQQTKSEGAEAEAQPSQKRSAPDDPLSAQEVATKRVKTEDEEYDQLGGDELVTSPNAPLPADSGIAA